MYIYDWTFIRLIVNCHKDNNTQKTFLYKCDAKIKLKLVWLEKPALKVLLLEALFILSMKS